MEGLSTDLFLVIVINVLAGGIYLGGLAMAIKFIEQHIQRLEVKQDKHNSLIERMFHLEEKVSSAHRRIDEMKEDMRGNRRK